MFFISVLVANISLLYISPSQSYPPRHQSAVVCRFICNVLALTVGRQYVSNMDLSADWFNLFPFIIGWTSFCTVCRVNCIGCSALHIPPKHRPTDIVYVCTPRPTHILLCPHYQLPNVYERSFKDESVGIYNIGIMCHRPA